MANAKFKLKKDDEVIVLTGKDKGKKGKIVQVLTAERRVIVEGVNTVTKHQKPTQFNAGGITKKSLPVHISNVALVDPKEGKATRVGYEMLKDGKKVRVAKKSGETL